MIRQRVGTAPVGCACALTRAWVWLYTAPLPPAARAERRDEIASDLWEHTHGGPAGGAARAGIALDVIRRCLFGAAADVVWCVEAVRRARRSGPAHDRRRFLMTFPRPHSAFTGLALISLIWIAVFTGLITAFGKDVSDWWSFLGVGAILIGIGLWQERERPALGETLVIVPTIAMGVITVWSIVSPILAVLLLVAWAARRRFFRG